MPLYKKQRSPYWYFTLTVDGRRVRGSTKQKRKQCAQLVLDEQRLKARQQGVRSLTVKAPTLAAYSTDFLKWVDDSHSIQPPTKRFYRHGLDMLKGTKLATMKLDAITNSDCETVTFSGGDCHANQALRTLRRMMGKAKETGRIFGELPTIKTRKVWARSASMNLAQAESITAKMPSGTPKDIFEVLRATGMRPSECFAMRWENLNLDVGVYKNPSGKTATARRAIPLRDRPLEILKRRRFEQGFPAQGWVFPAKKAKCGHVVGINKAYTVARKAAGLPDAMVLYTARHGVATEIAKVGTLKEVMDILGHSDARTALGYQHPDVTGIQTRLVEARAAGRIQ